MLFLIKTGCQCFTLKNTFEQPHVISMGDIHRSVILYEKIEVIKMEGIIQLKIFALDGNLKEFRSFFLKLFFEDQSLSFGPAVYGFC